MCVAVFWQFGRAVSLALACGALLEGCGPGLHGLVVGWGGVGCVVVLLWLLDGLACVGDGVFVVVVVVWLFCGG